MTGKFVTGKFAALVVLVAALGLVSCSSGSTNVGNASDSLSPLADFFGAAPSADFQDPGETGLAAANQKERTRQQRIAQCMAEEGFTYVPVEPGTGDRFMAFNEADVGTVAWTERYGLGVSTLWFSQQNLPSDLAGYEFNDSSGPGEGSIDPNAEITAEMQADERRAYDLALYGEIPEAVVAGAEVESGPAKELNPEDLGCSGKYEADDVYELIFDEFAIELSELERRIDADPRMVEADQVIVTCVQGLGYEYASLPRAVVEIEESMEALAPLIADQLGGHDVAAVQLSPELATALGDIQRDEIGLALAVDECGGADQSYRELRAEIRAEYEQFFVDDYRSELERFRDS